jgi:hypothetical protein
VLGFQPGPNWRHRNAPTEADVGGACLI